MSITVRAVRTSNPVFLAPMSGVTDLPFRRLAHELGAGLVVSEMVASEDLTSARDETLLKAAGQGAVSPLVIQLAGREARWMAEGARIAEAMGADIVDINMGCPARQVTRGASGSALMRDLDHALMLIEATVGAVKVPVTLKMRLGWDENSINAPELAKRAEDAGVQLVTVHGRTRCQFYKGSADWDAISAVKEAVSIPLIANGDGIDARDARLMLELSGADGVMIGRGAYGRPWRLAEIAAGLGYPGRVAPDFAERHALIRRHYEEMLEHYDLYLGVRCARKHLGWYLETLAEDGLLPPDAVGPWRGCLCREENHNAVLAGIDELFAATPFLEAA